MSANVDGFLSILEACRHVPVSHLVYASSSSVYGTNTKLPFSEDDPVEHPASLYAATKRSNELMAQTYAHLFRIRATGLRFFTVYGPWGRPDMAYYIFTRAISEGARSRCSTRAGWSATSPTWTTWWKPSCDCCPAPPLPTTVPAPHAIYNIGNHTPVASRPSSTRSRRPSVVPPARSTDRCSQATSCAPSPMSAAPLGSHRLRAVDATSGRHLAFRGLVQGVPPTLIDRRAAPAGSRRQRAKASRHPHPPIPHARQNAFTSKP